MIADDLLTEDKNDKILNTDEECTWAVWLCGGVVAGDHSGKPCCHTYSTCPYYHLPGQSVR